MRRLKWSSWIGLFLIVFLHCVCWLSTDDLISDAFTYKSILSGLKPFFSCAGSLWPTLIRRLIFSCMRARPTSVLLLARFDPIHVSSLLPYSSHVPRDRRKWEEHFHQADENHPWIWIHGGGEERLCSPSVSEHGHCYPGTHWGHEGFTHRLHWRHEHCEILLSFLSKMHTLMHPRTHHSFHKLWDELGF